MSIQHRSRIKSIADYTSNANSQGACCYARAEGPVAEYYNTCVVNGGHWQPVDDIGDLTQVACPNLGVTGCCCSCSYVDNWGGGQGVDGATGFFDAYNESSQNCEMIDTDDPTLVFPCYQGGLQDNITFCECSDRGGVWAQGISCDTYTKIEPYDDDANAPDMVKIGAYQLCSRGGTQPDVRWPGACCSGNTCDTTCSPKECAVIGNAHGATGISWNPNNYCIHPIGNGWYDPDNQGGDIVLAGCDSEQYTSGESQGFYEKDKRSGVYIAKGNINALLFDNYSDTLKSSCSYLKSKELVCSNETKTICDEYKGIWSGYNKDGKQIACSDTITTDIQAYMTNKNKIPRSIINTWKLGDRVLAQGRYLGEFIVADDTHSPGSECFGTSENTGSCYPYYPKNNDNTKNSNKTFAIIIAENDFGGSNLPYEADLNSSDVLSSSSWDSWYNHSHNNLNLTKNINRTYNKNVWWSWCIASKDLWGFVANQVNDLDFITNTTISDDTPNFPYAGLQKNNVTFYWTSTFEIGFDYGTKTQLVYCQSFGDSSKVVLSRRDNKHRARTFLALEVVDD
jgi:hypothetical protein